MYSAKIQFSLAFFAILCVLHTYAYERIYVSDAKNEYNCMDVSNM